MHKKPSLRTATFEFATENFPEVFDKRNTLVSFLEAINSPKYGLLIPILVVLTFILSQVVNYIGPYFFHIDYPTSSVLLEQRLSNLFTMFSISLVVMGWLITNIASKESISYGLLFKNCYLYPIFYFVVSLTMCMIVASLLKGEHSIINNLGNLVITASLLIIVALGLITFVFLQLNKVVNTDYFFKALEQQVMSEVYAYSSGLIISSKSGRIYKEKCEALNLSEMQPFLTDLSAHTSVSITLDNNVVRTMDPDIFASDHTFVIRDINLQKMQQAFNLIKREYPSYYSRLHLDAEVSDTFSPFFIKANVDLSGKFQKTLRSAYSITKQTQTTRKIAATEYRAYFTKKFLNDVKDGRKDNVEKALAVFSKIIQLENKISTL